MGDAFGFLEGIFEEFRLHGQNLGFEVSYKIICMIVGFGLKQ